MSDSKDAIDNINTYRLNKLELGKEYLNRGFKLIICHAIDKDKECTCGNSSCTAKGKHPIRDWSKKPENIIDTVEKLEESLRLFPYANIAALTGSYSGVFVLDIDGKTGEETFNSLQPEEIRTFVVKTGGGGKHYYFKFLEEYNLTNRVKFLPGLDLRTTGGYALLPPSNHLSGGFYEILNDSMDYKEPPRWLLERLDNSSRRTRLIEANDHGLIEKGRRNDTLFDLGRFWIMQNPFHQNSLINVLNAFNTGGTVEPLPLNEVNTICNQIIGHHTNLQGNLVLDDTLFNSTAIKKEDKKTKVPTFKFSPTKAAETFIKMYPIVTEERPSSKSNNHEIWIYQDGVFSNVLVKRLIVNRLRRIWGDGYGGENDMLQQIHALTMPFNGIIKMNPNPYLVCVEGKVIDFRTGDILEPDPKYLITVKLPIKYDQNAKCLDLLEVLWQIFEDPIDVQLIVDIAVLAAIRTYAKIWIMFAGASDNGKSQIVILLQKLLGPDNTFSTSLEKLTQSRFEVARLFNKLLVIYPEEPGRVREMALPKAISGGDRLTAEDKGKDPFNFVAFCLQIFTCNDPLIYSEEGEAAKQRTVYVDCPFSFRNALDPNDPKIKLATPDIMDLKATEKEISGFFNLMIKSAPRVLKNRRPLTTEKHSYNSYNARTASVKKFIETFLDFDYGHPEIKLREVFDGPYTKVCKKLNVTRGSYDLFCKQINQVQNVEKRRDGKTFSYNFKVDEKLLEEFINQKDKKAEYTAEKLKSLGICDEIIDLWRAKTSAP